MPAYGFQRRGTDNGSVRYVRMASRLFALTALLLIVASIAGYLVADGWIPWTYPIALFLVGLRTLACGDVAYVACSEIRV